MSQPTHTFKFPARDALKQTRKVAIGQQIMHGRGHLVGIKALGRGLMLSILRYGNEVRAAEPYFDRLTAKADTISSVHESPGWPNTSSARPI